MNRRRVRKRDEVKCRAIRLLALAQNVSSLSEKKKENKNTEKNIHRE